MSEAIKSPVFARRRGTALRGAMAALSLVVVAGCGAEVTDTQAVHADRDNRTVEAEVTTSTSTTSTTVAEVVPTVPVAEATTTTEAPVTTAPANASSNNTAPVKSGQSPVPVAPLVPPITVPDVTPVAPSNGGVECVGDGGQKMINVIAGQTVNAAVDNYVTQNLIDQGVVVMDPASAEIAACADQIEQEVRSYPANVGIDQLRTITVPNRVIMTIA